MKRRKIFALLIVMVIVFAFAACGGGGGNAPVSNPTPAPAPSGGGAAPVDDTVYDLAFALDSAPTAAYSKALDDWVDALREESNGRLNITIYYGGVLAVGAEVVDLVIRGGADMGWATTSLNPGYFSYVLILGAYGKDVTSTPIATHIMSNLYKRSEAFKKEYTVDGQLHPLAVHGQTPACLASADVKIDKPEQVKGLTIMVANRNVIRLLEKLEAAPIAVTINDYYENYSKNICRVSLTDGSPYYIMNLNEVVDYFCTFNFNTANSFAFMNQAKYDSLPADLQELLDSKFDELSLNCGILNNEAFKNFVQNTLPASNVELYNLDQSFIDVFLSSQEELIVQPWREKCVEDGFDPDYEQGLVEELIAEARQIYGSDYDWFS